MSTSAISYCINATTVQSTVVATLSALLCQIAGININILFAATGGAVIGTVVGHPSSVLSYMKIFMVGFISALTLTTLVGRYFKIQGEDIGGIAMLLSVFSYPILKGVYALVESVTGETERLKSLIIGFVERFAKK